MGRFKGVISIGAVLALAAALVGCTDADDIQSGNYTLRMVPEAINTGATDYECVTMDFGAVRLVPLDPDALDPLGASQQIALVTQLSFVNFQNEPCSQFTTQLLPSVPLASGEYVFDQLNFGFLYLFDGTDELFCSFDVNYLEFAPSPVITVGPSGANTVRITLDVEAIADDAINNFCSGFFFDPLSFVSVEPM